MKRNFLILLAIPALLGAGEAPVVTKDSAATFYRDFKRLTAEPRFVAPLTGLLCKIPGKELLDKEQAMTGPHTRVAIHIYANPSAAGSIAADAAEFPAGAVIVKEKLGARNAVSGIGGMIKRAKGYDPANGDWEFFFSAAGGEFSTGKLANCIDCHRGAKRDHVFSVWGLQAR